MATVIGTGLIEILPDLTGFGKKAEREAQTAAGKATVKVGVAPDVAGLSKKLITESASAGNKAGDAAGKGFGKKFAGHVDGIGRTALGGAAAAGALLGGALTKAFSDSLDLNSASDKMSAQLGLTGPAAEKAGASAKKLFQKGFGTDIGQVSDAVKLTIQDINGMRGASEKTLTDISGKVVNTANIFDQDLGGVTRAVGQLMKTGLAKDATQALDIVTAGFQNGADKSGDFLDTLNEYGTQFRKLGIDGATATGLISQGLQAGARDGDLVADALKEFSIRAIDGSKTTTAAYKDLGLNAKTMTANIAAGGPAAEAALGTVLNKLRAVKDPAQQASIATGLFGTQAEDLGKALFALNPDTAAAKIGNFKGAAAAAGDTLNSNTKASLQTTMREFQVFAVDILEGKVIPNIQKLIGFVKKNSDLFITAGTIVGALAVGVGVLSGVMTVLNLVLAANPVGLVIAGIAALIVIVVVAYKRFDTFRAIVDTAFKVISAIASFVWNNVLKPIFTGLIETAKFVWTAIQTMASVFTSAFNGIKGVVISVIAAVVSTFLGFVSTIVTGAAKAFGWVPGLGPKLKTAAAAFETFKNDVNAKLAAVKDQDVKINTSFTPVGILTPKGTAASKAQQEESRRFGFAFATGGGVHGPGTGTSDSIPALLSNNEHVWTAREVKAAGGHSAVEQMRQGVLRRAKGGAVGFNVKGQFGSVAPIARAIGIKTSQLASAYGRNLQGKANAAGAKMASSAGGPSNPGLAGALSWARSQAGKPYVWGGVGPGGYDCSGFMSAITNYIQGKPLYRRRFATGSMPAGIFERGPGAFQVGWFRGNPGHTAGTLNGVNVESRGGRGVVVGPGARGARDPLFNSGVYHLKGFAKGGAVGEAAFDLLNPKGKSYLGDTIAKKLVGEVPQYAQGTKWVPNDGLAMLHRGEGVIPAGVNRQTTASTGAGAVTVTVDNVRIVDWDKGLMAIDMRIDDRINDETSFRGTLGRMN